MDCKKIRISKAIDQLDANLSTVARVDEWAKLMGYDCPQKFGYKFMKYFRIRPCKILVYKRLKSITEFLRSDHNYSNFEIAEEHSLPDEKALNNFTKYHLGHSPTELKLMPEKELTKKFKKFGNNIQE